MHCKAGEFSEFMDLIAHIKWYLRIGCKRSNWPQVAFGIVLIGSLVYWCALLNFTGNQGLVCSMLKAASLLSIPQVISSI